MHLFINTTCLVMSYYYPIDWRPDYSPKAEAYIQFASVYKEAVQILLEEYMDQRPLRDFSLVPVLSLLVQYIELMLKGIILHCRRGPHEPIPTHDIAQLYRTASNETKERFGYPGQANEDAENFILALGEFDKKSQAFRYPETRRGESFKFAKVDGWLYDVICTIPKLKEIAEKVIGDLDGLAVFVELQKENEEEAFRIASEYG